MNHQGLVVGIGASAGGIEAIETHLENRSPSTGMSFIVIQHLSPVFGSVMDQLLTWHTSMPVQPMNFGAGSQELQPGKKLNLIRQVLPEVALIDIGLPELDGHQLSRRLRSEPLASSLKLIALTGYGQDSDRQAVIASGFDLHLVKPLNAEVLDAALSDIEIVVAAAVSGTAPSLTNNSNDHQSEQLVR